MLYRNLILCQSVYVQCNKKGVFNEMHYHKKLSYDNTIVSGIPQ